MTDKKRNRRDRDEELQDDAMYRTAGREDEGEAGDDEYLEEISEGEDDWEDEEDDEV